MSLSTRASPPPKTTSFCGIKSKLHYLCITYITGAAKRAVEGAERERELEMLQGPGPAWRPSRPAHLADLWPLFPSLNPQVRLGSETYIHSQGHLRSPPQRPILISNLKTSQLFLFSGTRGGVPLPPKLSGYIPVALLPDETFPSIHSVLGRLILR